MSYQTILDDEARCRWSPHHDDTIIYLKYQTNQISMLDMNQAAPNLVAAATGGYQLDANISDRREGKVIRTFKDIHSRNINNKFQTLPLSLFLSLFHSLIN